MYVSWTPEGWSDYVTLQSESPGLVVKVNLLIKEISRDHFGGIGKPEPLKRDFQGWWSRRISGEHRLVYRLVGKGAEKRIEIAQCRFHYRKE